MVYCVTINTTSIMPPQQQQPTARPTAQPTAQPSALFIMASRNEAMVDHVVDDGRSPGGGGRTTNGPGAVFCPWKVCLVFSSHLARLAVVVPCVCDHVLCVLCRLGKRAMCVAVVRTNSSTEIGLGTSKKVEAPLTVHAGVESSGGSSWLFV